jgi:hypothetical protein
MVQQVINIGSAANDGTGDPLRTAFTKANQNFTELYGRGAAGANFDFTDNTLASTNTNGNIELNPNGTGTVIIQDNKFMIAVSRTISNSIGSAGDKAGMICWTSNSLFICIADYDGSTAIWRKATLSSF